MKKAFIDWKIAAGTSFPINGNENESILSVFCSVYKLISPPACSKAPQKTIIIKNDKNITSILSFSTLVNGLFINSLSGDLSLPINSPTPSKY